MSIFFIDFFSSRKSNLKKIFKKKSDFSKKHILRFFSIEMSFKIDFWKIDFKWHFNWKKSQNSFFSKIQIFFEKIFFKICFLDDKKLFDIFLNTYIEVKFHALSIYEVFRAIRARQTTLWSLARCWYKKSFFFILNAVSGPYGLPGLWIFCATSCKSTHWFLC